MLDPLPLRDIVAKGFLRERFERAIKEGTAQRTRRVLRARPSDTAVGVREGPGFVTGRIEGVCPLLSPDVPGVTTPADSLGDRLAAGAHVLQSKFLCGLASVEYKRPLGELNSRHGGHGGIPGDVPAV